MLEITDIIYFLPVPLFLAIALYGLKRGKVAPPGLIAAAKGYNWGETDSKNHNVYWISIVLYLILAAICFLIGIFLSLRN